MKKSKEGFFFSLLERYNMKKNIYLILIVLATIFMSVGYATVNSVTTNLVGSANIKARPIVLISSATITSGTNGTDTSLSNIELYYGTMLKSKVVLGSNQNSTLTMTLTFYNNSGVKQMFTGISYGPSFYDNDKITYTPSGLSNGYVLNPGSSVTCTLTFSYNSNDTSNSVLNSYLNFNFVKYYTITYSNIANSNNYASYILETESTKTINFSGDVPYDVEVSPSTALNSYNNGSLVLNNIDSDITVNRYYSITYVTDGVNPSNQPTKYLHGSTVTFLDPSKANATFAGWYDNASYSGNAITSTNGLSGNLTLYSKWSTATVATQYVLNLVSNASTTSSNIITVNSEDSTCTNTLAYDLTTDNNLRYVGANPCNYVKFNCDSNDNCELWRIIGVMNGIDSDPVIKLIKSANSSDTQVWNSTNDNTWTSSSLYTYLNGTYLNSLNANVASDYMLNAQWNIGKAAYNSSAPNFYNAERGTKSTASYVGLYSPSDYGFATSATSDSTRSTCINNDLSSANITATCYDNNWLFHGTDYQWTITAGTQGNNRAIRITNVGKTNQVTVRQNPYNYKPVVYLKSTIKIKGGIGSQTSPFELSK